MNLFLQFNDIFPKQELAIATITEKRTDGKLLGKTISGAFVILAGEAEITDTVYYNRRNHEVVRKTTNVAWHEYGV